MKSLSSLLFLVVVMAFYKESKSDPLKICQNEHILWYEQAARNWEEALPIGNGRLGAMVYGDPKNEKKNKINIIKKLIIFEGFRQNGHHH